MLNKIQITIFLMLASNTMLQNTIFYGNYTKNSKKNVNVLSPIRNQNQPSKCGASWAFAISSAMSDQFNALKDLEFPEVVLSPQMLMTCGSSKVNKNCSYSNLIENADMTKTLERLVEFGISDESCNNWHSNDQEDCTQKTKCMDCANGEDINNVPNCFSRDYHSYRLKSSSNISYTDGNKNAINDIRTSLIDALNNHGPVVCNMKHSENMFSNVNRLTAIDIYQEDSQKTQDYATWVSVVGFIDSPKNTSSTNDVNNLWVIKTSFGDSVGYYGYLYLDADPDQNDKNILDNCFSLEINTEIKVVNNTNKQSSLLQRPMINSNFDITKPRFYFQKSSSKVSADSGLDEESNEKSVLDTPIFWGNVNGQNYLTWIKNQHIPTYCGSCWAQAATSVLNDRLNIQRINSGQSFPRHVLSVQSIINCNLGGTCLGGDSGLAWERAKTWKIPTETCKVYESKNPDSFSCEGVERCSNSSKDNTWAITDFNGITVQEWVTIRGEEAIKTHLADGPIACSFEVTDNFENYTPKKDVKVIFDETKYYFQINHAISIVGWDKDDNGEYWIVRNSWGIEYGYNGLFYIRTGNVLGMEAGCQVPTKFTFEEWKK